MQASAAVVLVVEDEFLIRLDTSEMLEAAGFATIEAANADEAIRILEGRDDVPVVVTDIDMPGSMDGLMLAHAVREKWPPVKLVLVSGKRILRPTIFQQARSTMPSPTTSTTSQVDPQAVAA